MRRPLADRYAVLFIKYWQLYTVEALMSFHYNIPTQHCQSEVVRALRILNCFTIFIIYFVIQFFAYSCPG